MHLRRENAHEPMLLRDVCARVSGQRVLGVMHAGGWTREMVGRNKRGECFGGFFCLFVCFSNLRERESSISFSNGTPH